MLNILTKEPPTWNLDQETPMELGAQFRHFRGLDPTDPLNYLDRVWQFMSPAETEDIPEPSSSLGIHEAFDYLETVVRHDPTISHPPLRTLATSFARLAYTCDTGLEFDDHVSALVDALATMYVPGLNDARRTVGPTLKALRKYAISKADPPEHAAIEDAVLVLEAAAQIRHGGEHSDAAGRTPQAFQHLGIRWPLDVWNVAWAVVLARTVRSLNVIREAIRRNLL